MRFRGRRCLSVKLMLPISFANSSAHCLLLPDFPPELLDTIRKPALVDSGMPSMLKCNMRRKRGRFRKERGAMCEKGAQNGDPRDLPACYSRIGAFSSAWIFCRVGTDFVSESPSGNQIHLYLCNGGATKSYAIRGEAVTDRGVKNIYWQYDETRTDVRWLSDEVVSITAWC